MKKIKAFALEITLLAAAAAVFLLIKAVKFIKNEDAEDCFYENE